MMILKSNDQFSPNGAPKYPILSASRLNFLTFPFRLWGVGGDYPNFHLLIQSGIYVPVSVCVCMDAGGHVTRPPQGGSNMHPDPSPLFKVLHNFPNIPKSSQTNDSFGSAPTWPPLKFHVAS